MEKDTLYRKRDTLRRKSHFTEKETLYGERDTLRKKRHFTEKEKNQAGFKDLRGYCFQVTIYFIASKS